MAKATAKPGPKTLNQNANPRVELETPLGRKIVYQELGPLERFNMLSVLGAKDGQNPATIGYASLVLGVRVIDGAPVEPVRDRAALDRVILNVGDDCLVAINDWAEAQAEAGISGEVDVDLAGE